MELDNDLYEKILKLSNEGNDFIEKGYIDDAIDRYKKAFELIPQPKEKWEASEWLLVALGDACFINKDYESALNYLFDSLKCPNALENPFINLRLGETFFELGNLYKAKEHLLQAYMYEGIEIFNGENEKYFDLIKSII